MASDKGHPRNSVNRRPRRIRGRLRKIGNFVALAAAVLSGGGQGTMAGMASAQTPPAPNNDGSYPVPADWPLIPSGIDGTSGFRLLFVTTSTRLPNARDIATYNAFVQTDAASGHSAIRPYSSTFRVVGSTGAVEARDNTNTNYTRIGNGVPIYWLNGDKAADNYPDFYDYTWDSYVRTFPDGTAHTEYGEQRIWTGTLGSGQRHPTTFLGAHGVKSGNLDSDPDATELSPLEKSTWATNQQLPFYGLSPVLRTDTSDRAWVTPASLDAGEGGASVSYTLRLNTDPGADVTVAVTSGDSTAVTVSPAELTFTHGSAGDWATPQTVTVTAIADTDADSEDVTITHSATAAAGPYSGRTLESVQVSVADSSPARVAALVLSTTTLSLDEGESDTYTVKLDSVPTGNVTVTIRGHSGSDLKVDTDTSTNGFQDSLTFTSTDWNTARTVTVTAEGDSDWDDDPTITLMHEASGGGYDSARASVTVDVRDDDDPPISLSTDNNGEVTEGGTLTITATAGEAPTGNGINVPVRRLPNPSTAGTSDYTLSGSPAGTIAIASGATSGAITLTATSGDGDEPDERLRLRLGALPSGYEAAPTDWLDIAIIDDAPTIVTLAVTDAAATEDSSSDVAGLRLTLGRALLDGERLGAPLNFSGGTAGTDFTLALTSSAASVAFDASTSTVTFTGQSGGSATTADLTLTPASDTDADDETISVSIPASSSNPGTTLAATNLSGGASGSGGGDITITDDETKGILISAAPSLNVLEGTSASYTVKLSSRPTGAVAVDLSGHQGTDLSLSRARLSFGASNWETPQTITVTANPDTNTASESITLTHTASGGGYVSVTSTLKVNVTDKDTAGLVLSPTTLTLREGTGGAYTVRLATRPSSPVRVAISGHSGTDVSLNRTSLTFDDNTWSTPQTVAVTAAPDQDLRNDSVILDHIATQGGYDGVRGTVVVNVTDDDQPVVTFALAAASIGEDGGAYSVTLNLQPPPVSRTTVSYLVSGDATPHTDYTMTGHTGALPVAAGAGTTTLGLQVTDDGEDESAETIVLTLTNGQGYTVGSRSTHTLTITDNDQGGGGGDGGGGGGGGGIGTVVVYYCTI